MSAAYIVLNEAKGGGLRWPWEPSPEHGVHLRPDASIPITACGLNFTGRFATTHPIATGDAFDCDECERAWLDTYSTID